jgi:glyoxylase-like metal-dependent hydrolase (beta-lactamase superfamily II)/8-oxo-dGTP pyrophosphatase MutT (NUDIX family)
MIRRGSDGGWQVVLGRRSRRARFLPGAWSFVGGSIEERDEPDRLGAFERCVSREVEEETGLRVAPESWRDAGVRVTPPIYPVRFDTKFFLTEIPDDAVLPSEPRNAEELEEVRFVGAGRALVEWESGESDIPPVLPPMLRLLADTRKRSVARLASKLAEINELEESVPRLEFVPNIWMLPVEAETLPPATHTNVWLVGGKRFLIVDPGSASDREIERLLAVIGRRRDEGHEPEAVFLTHHHVDHAAGAVEVARRLELPLRAHPETLERLDGVGKKGSPSTEKVADGDRLELAGLTVEAIHTPGHAAGHLALYVPEQEVAIVGDLLSGQSTILIDPEEGHMGDYMKSLRRLRDLRCRKLLPGHGIPLQERAIEQAIEHRWGREESVLASMGPEPRELDQVVQHAYVDLPDVPQVLKSRQALAHLIQLERKGVVRREGDGWLLAGGP